MKPAPRALAVQLWALKHDGSEGGKGLAEVPHLAASGRTSFVADKDIPKSFYRAAGFSVCGDRAVRVDILERLADLIRPAVAYRPGLTAGEPPSGTADRDGFIVTVGMTSLVGCSGESFASILRSLGYVSEQRKGPAITVPLVPMAATTPVQPVSDAEAAASTVETAAGSEQDDAQPMQAPACDAAAETPPAEPSEDLAVTAESAAVSDDTVNATPSPSETVAETAAEAETAVEAQATQEHAVEAEVALIEVWRPHRQHHQRRDRRPQDSSTQNMAHGAERSNPDKGAPASAHRERNDRSRHARTDRKPQTETSQPAEAGVAATTLTQGDLASQRHEKRPGDRRRDEKFHGEKRKQEGRKDQRHETAHESFRQGRRADERRERRQGSFLSTEKPRERERQPDPNSPFAKLLILKQQMESQGSKS